MQFLSSFSAKDIFIEINGVKFAAIQSYRLKTSKNLYDINYISQPRPLKTIALGSYFNIELSNLTIFSNQHISPLDIFNLTNFNLSIVKNSSRTIFLGCNWSIIDESTSINSPSIECITIIATEKIEVKNNKIII